MNPSAASRGAASLPLGERVELLVWFLEERAASKRQAAAMTLRKGIDTASPVGRAMEQRSYDQIERIHAQIAGCSPAAPCRGPNGRP